MHRIGVCGRARAADCGNEGRANAIDGAFILLKGARKERGWAIGVVMDVVALANNFQRRQAEDVGSGSEVRVGHATFRAHSLNTEHVRV